MNKATFERIKRNPSIAVLMATGAFALAGCGAKEPSHETASTGSVPVAASTPNAHKHVHTQETKPAKTEEVNNEAAQALAEAGFNISWGAREDETAADAIVEGIKVDTGPAETVYVNGQQVSSDTPANVLPEGVTIKDVSEALDSPLAHITVQAHAGSDSPESVSADTPIKEGDVVNLSFTNAEDN